MKKILTILFVFTCFFASAQKLDSIRGHGYHMKRGRFDSTAMIPTFCGVPTLRYKGVEIGAIAIDSCNNKFYFYNPKDSIWTDITSGSTVDTAGKFVNAVTSPNDSTIVVCKGAGCISYIIRGSPGQSIDTTGKFVNSVTFPTDSTAIVCKGGTCTQFSIKGGAGSSGGSQTDTTGKFVNSVVSNTDSTIIVCKAGTCIEYVIGSTIYVVNPLRYVDSSDGKRYLTIDTTGLSGGTPIDTANKWVTQTLRRADSVFYVKGVVEVFAYKDSVGSGSSVPSPNVNTSVSNNKFVRIKSGVIRPTATVTPNSPITWAFIDSAGSSAHRNYGFDSVNGNGDVIQIYYPYTKFVSSLVITPDEYLASAGVIVGSSVSQNLAQVYAYRVGANAGKLTGNTTSWTALHLTTSVLSYNTGTGLTVFTPTTASGTILGASVEVEGCQISYVGSNNYHIRRQYSGLGSGIIGFYLVDNATNAIVTGNLTSSDIVTIDIPRPKMIAIPAQTVASSGYPADLYTSGSNYWIVGVFELWFIAYPQTTTSNKMEWQAFKIGSNYATTYRITRATIAAPNTETNVFSGYGFSCIDASATSGTQYIYRMYATVTGTESLVTNEHCITQ